MYKPKQYHGRGTKVINMKELFAWERIDDQGEDRVYLDSDELERFRVGPGDLLFARRSFVLEGAGKCSMIGNPVGDTTFESSMIRARLNPDKALTQFVYYLFASPIGRAAMAEIATRTAVSGITGKNLENLRIPVPDVPSQRKISAILSAYDDLIENNNRRIKVLEEIAQRIYREWFVYFRYPGHESVPLVDSELGPIPNGWRVAAFTDLADILSGGTPRTTVPEYWDGDIPFFTPRDAPDTLVVATSEKHLTQVGIERCNSQIYPRGTVFITARGTVGKVVMAGVPMAMNQSCYAIRGREGVRQEFVLFSLRNQVDYLKANTGGATFDTIIVDTFRRMRSIIPPRQHIGAFASFVEPVIGLIEVLQDASWDIRATRDLLLPRLISGGIDVTGLDIAMPDAAA